MERTYCVCNIRLRGEGDGSLLRSREGGGGVYCFGYDVRFSRLFTIPSLARFCYLRMI